MSVVDTDERRDKKRGNEIIVPMFQASRKEKMVPRAKM
jgi:hypothetical protein